MTDNMTPTGGEITFTVKELFLEIRSRVEKVGDQIGELERRSVDQAQRAVDKIKELEDKVDSLEQRIFRLQSESASREAVEKFSTDNRKLTLGVAIAIAGMLANVVVTYLKH